MADRNKAPLPEMPPQRPATSREARQAQLENLAMDLAEKQMQSGEASAQVITHYLKSASTRGRIEELRLQHDIELMKAKKSQIESMEEVTRMLTEGFEAMGIYRMDRVGEEDVHGVD